MLVVAAVAIAVLGPLLGLSAGNARDGERADRLAALEARKEAKYREIRDAELDFRAGKLSEGDYRELDAGLKREAIEILDAIAAEGDRRADDRSV